MLIEFTIKLPQHQYKCVVLQLHEYVLLTSLYTINYIFYCKNSYTFIHKIPLFKPTCDI